MRNLFFVALVLLLAAPVFAQTAPRPTPPPGAKFELTADKASFALGEPIAVTVRFSTESSPFYVMRFGAHWESSCFPLSFTAVDGQVSGSLSEQSRRALRGVARVVGEKPGPF